MLLRLEREEFEEDEITEDADVELITADSLPALEEEVDVDPRFTNEEFETELLPPATF